MKNLIRWFDGLSKTSKIILALPFIDICWQLYRFTRSYVKINAIGIFLAILLIIFGPFFMWIVDIIFICKKGTVPWID